MVHLKFITLLSLLALFSLVNSTLGPGDKKKKKEKEKVEPKVKLNEEPVLNQNLVKQDISIKEIIKNNKKYCLPCASQKKFERAVLGYVTPWNSKGRINSLFASNFIGLNYF